MLVLKVTHLTPTIVSVQFVQRGADGDQVRGYAMPTVGEWHGAAWQSIRGACTVEEGADV